MPLFQYITRNGQSAKISGSLECQDVRAAVQILTEKQLIPIYIGQDSDRSRRFSDIVESFSFSKLLFLSILCSSLTRLIRSGLTIPQSMTILSRQFRQKYISSKLATILEKLKSGAELSTAFSAYPEIFPPYLIALCKAGESSGSLPEVLCKASDFFNRLRLLKKKISTALIYPTFLATMAILAFILLLLFVLPRIAYIYSDFNAKLPWQTKILLDIGSFLQHNIVLVVVCMITMISLFTYFLLSSSGRKKLKHISYGLPLIGKIISQAELADQLSISGILLSNGSTLPNALSVTGSLTEYDRQKYEFERISKMVESGSGFASAISESRIIPQYAKDILILGEEADCLPESLENSAEIINGQVEQKMALLTALFEPLIVIFIAIMIGLLMFSILWPIFNLDFMVQ